MSLNLAPDEASLLQHVEEYGMNALRAGELLGIPKPYDVLKRPHVQAARETMRRALQKRKQLTKEDVLEGIKAAIEQAYQIGDPASQIRGWSEIGKLLDMYKPTKINIQVTGSVSEIRKELAELDDASLMELTGESDVIDADFYQVRDDAARED